MTGPLSSAPALRYRLHAEAFVALVDERRNYSTVAWLTRVHALLPDLYAAALALDEVEPDTDHAHQKAVPHEQWKDLYDDLCGALGRWNYYWDVYDPYSESEREAVCGSLADDLADIYRDLRNGTIALGNAQPNDVLWVWRFDFESHWAAHATGALRALATAFFVHHAEEFPETFGNLRVRSELG